MQEGGAWLSLRAPALQGGASVGGAVWGGTAMGGAPVGGSGQLPFWVEWVLLLSASVEATAPVPFATFSLSSGAGSGALVPP